MVLVVGGVLECDAGLVFSPRRHLPLVSSLGIRGIDEDDKLFPLFGVGDDFAEAVGEVVEGAVQEVELEDMGFEEGGAVADAFAHDVHVALLQRGGPDAVFGLGVESGEEIAGAGGAVPDVVRVLPVLAEDGGDGLLGLFDPNLGREEGALALADVGRHEEVAAGGGTGSRTGRGPSARR